MAFGNAGDWGYVSNLTTTNSGTRFGYDYGREDGVVSYFASFPPLMSREFDVTGELMEITSMPTIIRKKRLTLFGKLVDVDSSEEEERSILALKWIKGAKQKMTATEVKEYEEKAELAFKEAVENIKLGLDHVADKFEAEMNKFLNKTNPFTKGYDTFITNKEIEGFRRHLPKNKELIIDELDEYEHPFPTSIQMSLDKAKKAKCFEKFVIFSVRTVKDPILFGVVKDEKDKFYFIDEWDDDVSIEDFLKYK